jgi:hypothetical protein
MKQHCKSGVLDQREFESWGEFAYRGADHLGIGTVATPETRKFGNSKLW